MSVYVENFETIFGVKNNIETLRNKVLELAIQGKLVEQDPNDEPASELVKKIKAERDELVKGGRIKKQKPLESIEAEEIPFELPIGWKWVRMQDVADTKDYSFADGPFGSDLKKEHYTESGVRIIQLSNIGEGIWRNENKKYTSPQKADELIRCNANSGDLVIAKMMPAGRACKVPDINHRYVLASDSVKFRPHQSINIDYIMYVLNTPIIRNCICDNAAGITRTRTSLGKLQAQVIPIPPQVEQYRIVEKIESLMSKIDKLEDALHKKDQLMELLPKAVVDAIGSCQTGEELKEQLQLVIENFETIFQVPRSMQELRNIMLQLAIEGKLAPQDRNDEPASELVKKIQAERNKLVKEGKIKKQKPLAPIEEDEITFEIPKSWEWMRLGDVISITSGNGLTKKNMTENGQYPVYGGNGVTGFHDEYNVDEETIVIGRVGYYCGSVHLTAAKSWVTDNAFITTYPNQSINKKWLIQTLKTMDLGRNDNATAQPVISQTKIYPLPIPIPPLNEQNHIVWKTESIMTLIDQMEDKLRRKSELIEKMAAV